MWNIPVFYLGEHTPEKLTELLNSNDFDCIMVEYTSGGKEFKYDNVELKEGSCVLKLDNKVQVSIDKAYFVYKTSNYLILKEYV